METQSTLKPVASWSGRGRLDSLGRTLVGTSRAGVEWWASADRYEAQRARFDARECLVERGLAQDIWGDLNPYGACPCRECRTLRAEASL